MSKSDAPFNIRWSYVLGIYAILLLISYGITSKQEVPKLELKFSNNIGQSSSTILYLGDPNKEFKNKDSLEASFEVISVQYSESSFEKLADSILSQIQELQLYDIHLLGEGIGGSIAIHLAAKEDSIFKSLSLINANGIDELELLGGYTLNHAIYNIRKFSANLLKYGVPNFGYFKSIDVIILRNSIQFDSDQRLIRSLMQTIEIPARVYHFPDARINESVSIEHARLLPQSDYLTLNNEAFYRDYISFIDLVNSDIAIDRSEVTNFAQQQSLMPFDPNNGIKAEGKALLILMLVIIVSTFISEDLTCIGTGLMIARGLIGFVPGVIACLLGIFIGDILLYLAGKWLGSNTLNRAPLKWFISEKDIQHSHSWFEAKGPAIIIASRFIPGSRFPTYFSAGAIGANFVTFITYFGIASIIWTPMLVGLAVLLGQEMIGYFSVYQDYALWVLLAVLILLFMLFKIVIPSLTFKGRRLLVGRFKRLTQWEYWSPFILYFPVILYMILLWIKYRSISVVTLANPGIEHGGFVQESKSLILKSIKAKEVIAKFVRLNMNESNEKKMMHVKSFMQDHTLDFPLIIKPDIGERGKGVVIVRNEEELKINIGVNEPLIVQEFIDGIEFGVFYSRNPDEEKGTIISLTEKKYIHLIGDGKHTLEHLILNDSRAVSLAEVHFEYHIDRLFSIPEKGEKITLVELGTHARGALFKDGKEYISSDLIEEIDRISKSLDGFYFGRFDIKVPTKEELMMGKNLKVLELNGITSEATHIYDPKYSFSNAVKTLTKQWSIAYKTGHTVKQLNPSLQPPSFRHLISLVR